MEQMLQAYLDLYTALVPRLSLLRDRPTQSFSLAKRIAAVESINADNYT